MKISIVHSRRVKDIQLETYLGWVLADLGGDFHFLWQRVLWSEMRLFPSICETVMSCVPKEPGWCRTVIELAIERRRDGWSSSQGINKCTKERTPWNLKRAGQREGYWSVLTTKWQYLTFLFLVLNSLLFSLAMEYSPCHVCPNSLDAVGQCFHWLHHHVKEELEEACHKPPTSARK